MSGSSFSNVFGGTAVRPSQPSYEALTISANTALVWPLEATAASPYVAAAIDVTATTGGLLLLMPPGNNGSAGVASMVTNVGSVSFVVADQAGNAIVSIAPTQSWLLILRSNSTVNGSWGVIQMGTTTASANSAALAGPGLVAAGALLETNRITTSFSANTLLTTAYRSQAVVWTGGVGTLTLDTIANLTAGWECLINNNGTGAVTITCSGGATINGAATFVMQPGNSGILVCAAGGFLTFGALVTTLPIAAGGTGATTATGALTNLGGTSIGKAIFTSPTSSSVLALLGISNSASFTEATVGSNQSPSLSAGGTVFICTGVLTITLPLTTTLTTHYVLIVSAAGGAVTLTPNAADKINGGSVGVSITVASGNSAFVITDSAGNWYTVFQGVQSITLSGDVSGTGTTSIATTVAKIGGVSVTLGGALTTVGANTLSLTTTANTALTLPTTGTLSTITAVNAGSGMSGGGSSGSVTLTNAGVTSVIAGSGISVSGATGAVTVTAFVSSIPIMRTLAVGTLYTAPTGLRALRVFVSGATGGQSSGTSRGGNGGSGYSEKYYSSPASTYAYAVGAGGSTAGGAGGTSSFDVITVTGSAGVTSSTGSAGGVGSGGDFNATGGTGGNGATYSSLAYAGGGGGAAGSRAGNGFAGAAGVATSVSVGTATGGGGGGTGAVGSGVTGGAAKATLSATAISVFDASAPFTFSAGSDGTIGVFVNGVCCVTPSLPGNGPGGAGATSSEVTGYSYVSSGIGAGGAGGVGSGGSRSGSPGVIVVWEYL